MRAWLHDNGFAGVREAVVIFAGLPGECVRDATRVVLRRLNIDR